MCCLEIKSRSFLAGIPNSFIAENMSSLKEKSQIVYHDVFFTSELIYSEHIVTANKSGIQKIMKNFSLNVMIRNLRKLLFVFIFSTELF